MKFQDLVDPGAWTGFRKRLAEAHLLGWAFRRGGTCLGLALGALLISALRPVAAGPIPLNVVYMPVIDSLPLFVAQDQGFFSKHDLNVTMTGVANQSVVVSSLASGSAQIGTAITAVLLQADEAGLNLVVLGGASVFPVPKPTNVGVAVRTDSGIKTPADLVGKKLAVVGLRSYHDLMVRRWLKQQAVDPSRVNFVEVPFPQMSDVLRGNQVDAVVVVDPFFHHIVDSKIGYVLGDFVANVPDGTLIQMYASQKSWAESHPEIVKGFLASLEDAGRFIKSNDLATRQSLSRWTKQPDTVVASATIPNYQVPVTSQQIQFWIDLARQEDVLQGAMDPNSVLFKPQ